MTTLALAAEAVIDLTGRSDKEALIRRKINAACRLIQSAGTFPQDLYEASYSGASIADAYIQSLTLPDRARQIAYIQDPDRTDRILLRTVAWALDNPDSYDIGYQAGSVLQLRLTEKPTSINVGVYRYLEALSADADTNWVLTDMFELVVDYAATWVGIITGNRDMISAMAQFSGQQLQVYINDRIQQRFSS